MKVIFLVIISLICLTKETSTIVAKDISVFCDLSFYFMKIGVNINPPLDDYIPFTLQLSSPENFRYKCIIKGPENRIFCSFLEHYNLDEYDSSEMILPLSFPSLEKIKWDYDSFVKTIYRKYLNPKLVCNHNDKGYIVSSLKSSHEWFFTFEIEEISSGQCSVLNKSNKLQYSFNMLAKIVNITDNQFVETNMKRKKEYEIDFLQDIWLPISLEIKYNNVKNVSIFSYDNYYNFAFCSTDKINKDNFNISDSIILFRCNIPISDGKTLIGPIKIEPFYDFSYISLNIMNKTTIQREGFSFNIKKSERMKNNNMHLFVNNSQEAFKCPDKLVFKITSQNNITMKKRNENDFNFYFLINGTITNNFDVKNKEIIPIETRKKEIVFELILSDNLAEINEDKKIKAKCVLPPGLMNINNNALIKCEGNKITNNKNIDLTLNWANEENKYFDDLIVLWPDDKVKTKKNLYTYSITCLSIQKGNNGCYDEKYYFFMDIYELNSEPKIEFELELLTPQNMKVLCKLYDSSTLKCEINAKYQKLYKNSKIKLKNGFSQTIINNDGNIINYSVDTSSLENYIDLYIKINEDCGNMIVVGTLKDIGLSYKEITFIFILGFVGLGIIIFGVCFCIIHRITHKYKKGKYFSHVDEGTAKNNSTVGVKYIEQNVTTSIPALGNKEQKQPTDINQKQVKDSTQNTFTNQKEQKIQAKNIISQKQENNKAEELKVKESGNPENNEKKSTSISVGTTQPISAKTDQFLLNKIISFPK